MRVIIGGPSCLQPYASSVLNISAIGLAAGLTKSNEGLGAVGNYKGLADYTALGGVLTVFALRNYAERTRQKTESERLSLAFWAQKCGVAAKKTFSSRISNSNG